MTIALIVGGAIIFVGFVCIGLATIVCAACAYLYSGRDV